MVQRVRCRTNCLFTWAKTSHRKFGRPRTPSCSHKSKPSDSGIKWILGGSVFFQAPVSRLKFVTNCLVRVCVSMSACLPDMCVCTYVLPDIPIYTQQNIVSFSPTPVLFFSEKACFFFTQKTNKSDCGELVQPSPAPGPGPARGARIRVGTRISLGPLPIYMYVYI